MEQTPVCVLLIGSFQTARRKTMLKNGCRKIAAMHVTLNVAINNDIPVKMYIELNLLLKIAQTENF